LLGIDSERALRLLHKTQSAKNLGDLNVFLRDFMLDPPETFKVAERLVSEFGELNAAHQAVVAARRQIDTLAPARDAHTELEQKRTEKSLLDMLNDGVDAYREQRRRQLLEQRIAELGVDAEGAGAEATQLAAVSEREFQTLSDLRLRRQGLGGGLIEQLVHQLRQAEAEQTKRRHKHDQVSVACRALGWDLPEAAPAFVQRVAAAKSRLLESRELAADLERRKDDLKERLRQREVEFRDVRAEIGAMERQPSNIPARMLEVRARMAETLGVAEESLPFAGELLQVKPEAAVWQGAIERVLHSFAQSLLGDERHYAAVSAYVNERNTGERLVYFRTLRHAEARRSAGPSSLVRKLDLAPGSHAGWLRDELATRFDYDCTDTLTAFRNASRAVTREGQVKHSGTRHEKDDRRRVDDRSRWVLGFDNKEKLSLYKERAAQLGADVAELGARLEALGEEGARQQEQLLYCQTLSNLSWDEVDVPGLLQQIEGIRDAITRETRARPELAQLDAEIEAQTKVHERAAKAITRPRSRSAA
jgi:uncharacterized protein YPO0396